MIKLIINTLGPEDTDSYTVALKTITSSLDKIILYSSFDDIIEHLSELVNQYILIPVAFESSFTKYDWKDFNFEFWEYLEIKSVISRKTKPMVLLENLEHEINKAIIHPATKIFMTNYLNSLNNKIDIIFEKSKVCAFERFKSEKYRYTICSKDAINNDCYLIKDIFEPHMIWCLYRVKGEIS